MVTVKEWVQREWTNPGANLYRSKGDFYNLSALLPDSHGSLKRAPAWSSHMDLPANIVNLKATFYDEANGRYVVIGSDNATPTKIVSAYYSSLWTANGPYDLVTATATLGGLHIHNTIWWGEYLYVIGADYKVYRGASYTSALSEFYATADAKLLAPCGDRMYLITTTGKVLRLNDANDAFETHYDPIANLEIQYVTAFRGYLALFARADDGTLFIYRLPDRGTETPVTMHQIARIANTSGDFPSYGSLFAVHDDEIYFTTGRHTEAAEILDVYTFNGSQVEHVTQLTSQDKSSEGFITWRGYLLYYALTQGGTQTFKALIGDHFVDFAPLTTDTSAGYVPAVGSLSGHLVISAHDDTDGEGIHHCGGSNLTDGHLITSRLDMGHPGLHKRLNHIIVLLDGAATDFKIVIKYRVDDDTSWTTATTANDTYRAIAADLSTHFYTLQLRIELDDDTGNDEDIRILAVSALYSIEGP